MKLKPSNIASSTRLYRKLHKWVAIPLLLFFLTMGITGLLLGWKKQINMLPPTQKGETTKSLHWISLDSIQHIAQHYANTHKVSAEIDRIDIRPKKGVAKIVFVAHFMELQIDCTSGSILSVSTRTSDIIEKIHDGSIIDFFIKTQNDPVKLIYTSLVGIGLILLTVSGFFLWYNPIKMRKSKDR